MIFDDYKWLVMSNYIENSKTSIGAFLEIYANKTIIFI